jgi:hypothetical protein
MAQLDKQIGVMKFGNNHLHKNALFEKEKSQLPKSCRINVAFHVGANPGVEPLV